MSTRPPVWQMIKEAADELGGGVIGYAQIKDYIRRKYGEVNEGTINAQITICTVNQPSRVHYPENNKPRLASSRYDFLYSVGRGQVVRYDPAQHGVWEIREDEYGKLTVAQSDVAELVPITDTEAVGVEEESLAFPFESHLRDFIAKNLDSIRVEGKRLKLYAGEQGRDGIEYPTDVGPIDILAVDEDGALVVFELKLSRGEDRTIGQTLRYMGWLQKHLAPGRKVRGVIVAREMSEQLKYAVSITPGISLFEYEISFTIRPVSLQA